MAERYQRNRRERQLPNEDTYGLGQAEQYDDSTYDQDFDTGQRGRGYGGQMGERGGYRGGGGSYVYDDADSRRSRGGRSGSESFAGYGRSDYEDRPMRRGGSNFDNSYDRGFGSPGDENRSMRGYESGGYDERSRDFDDYRGSNYRGSRYREEGGQHERGFFEKAGDQIASWFGDEDAARRVQQDHRGAGPSNYTRSDDRILEDACDNLTDDWAVDARNIQVTVKGGEVTLDGTVDSRATKRRAEDCVDCISGVKHVQNNLRVQDRVGQNADYSADELENGRL